MASGAASLGSSGGQSAGPSSGQPAGQPTIGTKGPAGNWTEMVLLSTIVGLTFGIIVGLASFYW